MSKFLLSLFLSVFIFFANTALAATGSHGTADEAVAMVNKVIAFMKINGKDKTIAEVNNLQGRFRDRDLYISINDMNGINLAHGANARIQGKNLLEMKDADGKPFYRERIEMAKTKGEGWQDYKFVNPETKQIENKAMYFKKQGDLIINCGIYK
ncbi:cache domain-containing protein [Undibacterium jejuense]|uniref:Cache domain-containing protein n=1 Tax=Undibacterium jejuense TaxID=1344949 RepID=A0A923KQW5_9BURK|nr:cache domain-containing protein [Undibacterium jejuense]MBC3863321.1 cache domain-containing protein [Undibacterium jejuense]